MHFRVRDSWESRAAAQSDPWLCSFTGKTEKDICRIEEIQTLLYVLNIILKSISICYSKIGYKKKVIFLRSQLFIVTTYLWFNAVCNKTCLCLILAINKNIVENAKNEDKKIKYELN